MKKQENRKYMDDALVMIKDMQKNKESSIFKSVTDRFREISQDIQDPPNFQIGVGGTDSSKRKLLSENSTM